MLNLLDLVRFARPLVEQLGNVSVSEKTGVKHVFHVVKIVHGDAVERIDKEHAVFRPVRPQHQTVHPVVPMDLKTSPSV